MLDCSRSTPLMTPSLFGRHTITLFQPMRHPRESEKINNLLDFEVVTSVDVERWAATGEDMLDLRRSGRFAVRGALQAAATDHLFQAWHDGDSAGIKAGITLIRDGVAEGGFREKLRQQYTARDVADWLYSVDHISLEYGLKYRGVQLRNLSPGTRGIVLLILYLALDVHDDRPLIIDQPEENLDNASVYAVLVEYFREAKRRRQIIVVTHNPNLVVNTDAEQVIVASATRSDSGLPVITYMYGPLEAVRRIDLSVAIKDRVCDILEGGQQAFRRRVRRYG